MNLNLYNFDFNVQNCWILMHNYFH